MLISYFISPFCTNGSFVSINQFFANFNYFIGINLIYRKISLHKESKLKIIIIIIIIIIQWQNVELGKVSHNYIFKQN